MSESSASVDAAADMLFHNVAALIQASLTQEE